MHARMKHPAFVLPGAMQALTGLSKSVERGGLPRAVVNLVELRASQINGCGVCVGMHAADMRSHPPGRRLGLVDGADLRDRRSGWVIRQISEAA
jgi:alkylhydroperoxidase family enzyme